MGISWEEGRDGWKRKELEIRACIPNIWIWLPSRKMGEFPVSWNLPRAESLEICTTYLKEPAEGGRLGTARAWKPWGPEMWWDWGVWAAGSQGSCSISRPAPSHGWGLGLPCSACTGRVWCHRAEPFWSWVKCNSSCMDVRICYVCACIT